MKSLRYIALAFAGVLLAGCMGENYADPTSTDTPFGNNSIDTTSNIITIAQLKDMYKTQIATDYRNGNSYSQVTEDLKIKAVVTSSDETGNVYNEIALQDSTGAIIAAVAQGGTYGFLPVGSKIVVSLKDLYVGNYGLQAEIGVPTTNANLATYVGRMSRALWNDHYRVISTGNTVEPETFDAKKWDLAKDGGKLGVIKGVHFKRTSVDSTYSNANGGAGSVSWKLTDEKGNTISDVIVYNSNFADFASETVPAEDQLVDITGIFKRFNNTWEIIIRSTDDIQSAKPSDPYEGIEGTGKGTLEEPYDVTRALSLINNNKMSDEMVYVSGIISQIDEVDTGSYGNATYYISLDGKTDTQLEVFRGYYLDKAKFTAADQIAEGK